MPFQLPSLFYDLPKSSIVAVGIPLTLGILSGSPTSKVVRTGWYQSLRAPPGRPPRQAFPIVWSALYVSMGYASHLAANLLVDDRVSPAVRDQVRLGLTMYYGQLVLNFAWSPLFFILKKTGLALLDCTMLTVTTYVTTALLHGPSEGNTTVYLVPYCLWLTYATYLNGGIWILNKTK